MNLIERAKNIVLRPKTEWPVIAGETPSTTDLFTGYAIPLALIGPVAGFIGFSAFGAMIPGGMQLGAGLGLVSAVLSFVLALAAVFVLGLIINALAPTFGGTQDKAQALKLAVYASTPSWLGGIFGLIPLLSILSLLASAYSIYLLYLGLPVLMKSPQEKSVAYTAVAIAAAIVLWIIVSALTGAMMWSRVMH